MTSNASQCSLSCALHQQMLIWKRSNLKAFFTPLVLRLSGKSSTQWKSFKKLHKPDCRVHLHFVWSKNAKVEKWKVLVLQVTWKNKISVFYFSQLWMVVNPYLIIITKNKFVKLISYNLLTFITWGINLAVIILYGLITPSSFS